MPIGFRLAEQCSVETDSTNYENVGVLIQKDEDGELGMVGFSSRPSTQSNATLKYMIRNSYQSFFFEKRKPDLEGTALHRKCYRPRIFEMRHDRGKAD